MTSGSARAIVARMTVITMLTDFGMKDGYPGVMKGVIWGIAPDAQIADLTHQISPQNVLEGALVLGRAARFFPPGTIHLAVVDPGVGTTRRPIAARLGSHFFVGPDNGLCSLLLAGAREAGEALEFFHLDRPQYWLSSVSSSFHGRDIFAPVAAHLSCGVPLKELGTTINDPVVIQPPHPVRTETGWRGQVILVDSFGNLSTNISREHLEGLGEIQVRIAGQTISGLSRTFGSRQPGELLALLGEAGDLSVAVVNGSAARRLGVEAGEEVDVYIL